MRADEVKVKKKILVIDDDRDVQTILRTAFERAGYTVFSALDAMQGPMQARQMNPDLIVLDVMMPAGGGKAVYARLKQAAKTASIPVLIYSAMPRDQVLKEIPVGDSPLVLSKPAPLDKMLALIAKVLSGE